MGNAFQDQLRKAGLIDDKKIKKAKAEQRLQEKQQRKGVVTAEPAISAADAARQAAAEKAERDRQLNLQRQAQAEQRAIAAQIRQIIEAHRVPAGPGDRPYQFEDAGKVQRLFVTPAQHAQLVQGTLAVVKLDGQYALVPAEAAHKIRARDASHVLVLHEAAPPEPPADDPYAQFKVPDDLMW